MSEVNAAKIAKLPKWLRDHMQVLNAEIRRLEKANDALRGDRKAEPDSPGYILLDGYGGEPLPLGKYFRLYCTAPRGDGVEVCMEESGLVARVESGYVSVIPRVSNVISLRHVPYDD